MCTSSACHPTRIFSQIGWLILIALLLTNCVWQRTREFVVEQQTLTVEAGGWTIEPKCRAFYKETLEQSAGHRDWFPLEVQAFHRRVELGDTLMDFLLDSLDAQIGGAGAHIPWRVSKSGFDFRDTDRRIGKWMTIELGDSTGHVGSMRIPEGYDTLFVTFYATLVPGRLSEVPESVTWDIYKDAIVHLRDAARTSAVVTATMVRKESKSLFFGF